MGGDSGRRRLRAFGSLAGNRALLRVLAAYLLFILTEYAVWIAMLVFAYSRGGQRVRGVRGPRPGGRVARGRPAGGAVGG
jgi:hypothetical protein